MPGSQNPIVLTDRARELANPSFEQADPGVVERANTLAARAPKAVDADSGLYLCHNYCELGAVSFASVLQEIKEFVETHPDDVIIIDIQDATTPADTAQAFIDAGLEEHIATLEAGGAAADAAGADRRRHDGHRVRRGRRWRRGARLVPAGVPRLGPGDAVQVGFGRRLRLRAEPRWDRRRAVPRQPLGDHVRAEPEHGRARPTPTTSCGAASSAASRSGASCRTSSPSTTPRAPTSSSSSPSSTSSCSTSSPTTRSRPRRRRPSRHRRPLHRRPPRPPARRRPSTLPERRGRPDRDDPDGRRSGSVLPDDQRRPGLRHGATPRRC